MHRALVALTVVSLVACSSDSGTDPNGNANGNGNTLTANTAGVAFEATTFNVVAAGGGTLNFAGFTALSVSPVRSLGFAVLDFNGPGTYDLGPATSTTGATYTFTPSGGTPSQWSTFQPGSSGSITVSTATSSRIAGTFQFVGSADPGTAATGTFTVTNGAFDITF